MTQRKLNGLSRKIRAATPEDIRLLVRSDCGNLLVLGNDIPGFICLVEGRAEHHLHEDRPNPPVITILSRDIANWLERFLRKEIFAPIIRDIDPEQEENNNDDITRQEQALEQACEEGKIPGAMPADF